MMGGFLGSLSFTYPWMLAGLLALPAIWLLLRLTPPRPQTVAFPPVSLLLGLRVSEKTPVRSPWWLTLLRMLVAAGVIAALAGPVIKPQSAANTAITQPLVVVVDNSWAAASRWVRRQSFAEHLASAAEEGGQALYLIPTEGPAAPLSPLTPEDFRQRFASLVPEPFAMGRAAAAKQIEKELQGQRGKVRVAWLSDGIEDAGAAALGSALSGLASDGAIDIYSDLPGAGALGIARVGGAAGAIRAKVMAAGPGARRGQIAAVTARGEILTASPFDTGASSKGEATLDLPLDLRNQVARLEIPGEDSAGAVYLFDSRSQRRRVGLVASEGSEEAQPLLSPAYYLERALIPFAEVTRARTANLDHATADLIAASPSIVILSDVGRLAGNTRERLKAFVEKGGMLIRFAGPRLEQGGDSLLPAPLREGGRSLGGTMTWTSPQKPAPFEQDSPFNGLAIPADVTVSQQVLSDPSAMPRHVTVWARLMDGTPLVTAAKRGAGVLVFFHITANPDWSNLPISGLFVEMMQKILELSPLLFNPPADDAAKTADAAAAPGQEDLLKPWRVLDGFGKLAEPSDRAKAIPHSGIDKVRSSAANPAGLYGPQNALHAINALKEGDTLRPLKLPANAHVRVFADAKTIALAPWLYLTALLLFLADGAICTLFLGAGAVRWRRGAAAAALGLALFAGLAVPDARADTAKNGAATTDFALQASLETRLAYVVTGNGETDRISKAGLLGLSKILNMRTAVEPGEPMGIDPARDELVFFPLIYWPVLPDAQPLPDRVLAKVDAYMKQGGLIVFDTKNDGAFGGSLAGATATPLGQLLGKLDLPPLQRVPEGHVLTKAFYLLQSFPGRWDNGDPWVEAQAEAGDSARRSVKSDGVSSIIVTSNDLAAAWALDDSDRPMFAAVPGGEEQRELSYRAGVNIVMYALTGNYKADQVHVPAILERLGH